MNIELSKKSKNGFEKDFFKSMNNTVFLKNNSKCKKNRDMKLVTTKVRKNYLVSETNYHTSIGNISISNRNGKKTEIFMNKPSI